MTSEPNTGFGDFDSNIIDISLRAISIMIDEISVNDISYSKAINDIIKYMGDGINNIDSLRDKRVLNLFFYYPEKQFITNMIKFNQKEVEKGFELGIEDGKKFLESL